MDEGTLSAAIDLVLWGKKGGSEGGREGGRKGGGRVGEGEGGREGEGMAHVQVSR